MIIIDPASPVAPYEQIRGQFARKIREGDLVVGTRLPTVRGLAGDLGLAVNTVARAYRELEDAGLIETRGRAGSFVAAEAESGRHQVRLAAEQYARLALDRGISADEACRIVSAALDALSMTRSPAAGQG